MSIYKRRIYNMIYTFIERTNTQESTNQMKEKDYNDKGSPSPLNCDCIVIDSLCYLACCIKGSTSPVSLSKASP